MCTLPDKSIDMVLCDPPFGTTANKSWDKVIPFEGLWRQYERIIKDDGAIVLMASQPFATDLIISNRKLFKYEMIWEKSKATNFLNVKHQPLKAHENILVFSKAASSYSKKTTMKYNPQMTDGKPYVSKTGDSQFKFHSMPSGFIHRNNGTRYPRSVVYFPVESGLHPTQKPVRLFEYLIKTYTNPGDLVLDNCIGSGTTAIACINTNRKYIGFEMDSAYFKMAEDRIKDIYNKLNN